MSKHINVTGIPLSSQATSVLCAYIRWTLQVRKVEFGIQRCCAFVQVQNVERQKCQTTKMSNNKNVERQKCRATKMSNDKNVMTQMVDI
jgi:hypothetical protein